MPAVCVDDLVVRYGDRQAVRGLSLVAPEGAVTALVGPNGAGKTSTVEVCVGLRTAASGSVEVLGTRLPVTGLARTDLHRQVGVMLQDGGLYSTARPREMIAHLARLYPQPWAPDDLLAAVGIDPVTRTPLRRMSGGEQRRVAAAAALVGRPRVVFLDEPTTGLDPAGRRAFHDLLREQVAAGCSVLLTTHLLDDVERLADHVVVVAEGRTVASGSVADLTGEEAVAFRGPSALDVSDLAAALPPGCRVDESAAGYRVVGSTDPAVLATVAAWCSGHGIPAQDIRWGRRSLEDVVIALTAKGADGQRSSESAS